VEEISQELTAEKMGNRVMRAQLDQSEENQVEYGKQQAAAEEEFKKLSGLVTTLYARCFTLDEKCASLEAERVAHKELLEAQGLEVERLTASKIDLEAKLAEGKRHAEALQLDLESKIFAGESRAETLETKVKAMLIANKELAHQCTAVRADLAVEKRKNAELVKKDKALEAEVTALRAEKELYAPALAGYRQLLKQPTTRKALLRLSTHTGGVRGEGPNHRQLAQLHEFMLAADSTDSHTAGSSGIEAEGQDNGINANLTQQ